jgi:hypothetical protein
MMIAMIAVAVIIAHLLLRKLPFFVVPVAGTLPLF